LKSIFWYQNYVPENRRKLEPKVKQDFTNCYSKEPPH
jgi:hypothetical protein